MARWFAGIDWSERGHDVAVLDADGEVVGQFKIPETPDGVQTLRRTLAGLSSSHRHSARQVPIAIETSQGLLVAWMRSVSLQVHAINPTVVARYRQRLNPTRRKADKSDARLLAHIMRVDGHLHRPLPHNSVQAAALTVLSRTQIRLTREQRHQTNQLRSHLHTYYPAALAAWRDLPGALTRPEARAVLAAAPTPAHAARLSYRELVELLAAAGRTRQVHLQADRLHTLFGEPQLRQPRQIEEAMGVAAVALLRQLDQTCRTLDQITAEMIAAYQAHPHAHVYASFPGMGPVLGARMLGEIGDDPARFPTARGLRAFAGASPLTWQSGGSRVVTHRRVANKTLKVSGHLWAFCALTRSPGARAHYDRRRALGNRHAEALRHLHGRLLGCLHHCVLTGQHYREEIAFPVSAPPAQASAVAEPQQ